jgi:hypothetical protein
LNALAIDRRAAVEAILRARGVQVVRHDEQRSGIAVSPNGLSLRVMTPAPATPEEDAALRGGLLVAVMALRAGGIPVIVGGAGISARIGCAPALTNRGTLG